MVDVKSTKNPSVTLLHYFADYLANYKDKSVFQCLKEFNVVHESARESTIEVSNQVTQLSAGLSPIKAHLSSGNCDDSFGKVMSSWVPLTEQKVNEIQRKNQEVQKGLLEILNLFGEPPNTKSEEFFWNFE